MTPEERYINDIKSLSDNDLNDRISNIDSAVAQNTAYGMDGYNEALLRERETLQAEIDRRS